METLLKDAVLQAATHAPFFTQFGLRSGVLRSGVKTARVRVKLGSVQSNLSD